MAILSYLFGPAAVFATEQAESENPAQAIASDSETSSIQPSNTSRPMSAMGMGHKGHCKHGKGHGGMKHGHQGKGEHGKGHHDKHAQVVKRLDLIEARLAKIEVMLENLMRR